MPLEALDSSQSHISLNFALQRDTQTGDIMYLLTPTLLILFCYLVYSYLRKKLDYFNELGVPSAPAWPFFGNMGPSMFRQEHIFDTVKKIYNYNREAKYIGAFNFTRPVVVVRDPELIKNITIKHSDNFPDHQQFIDETVDPLFGHNLFSMAGDRWKEARNLLTPAFTSSKMKLMFDLMGKCAENFVDHLARLAENPKNAIGTKDLFTRYTNDVIASCAFGLNVDSLKEPKNEFYVLGREATNFEGILSLKFFLARAFPAVMKIFKITLVGDHIRRFFENIVKSTVDMRDQEKISRPDMIQLMMDARGKTSNLLKLDITEMTAQAFIFFFGGFDTTSTQMCILAHELALNPDIQEKLQAEIDDVLASANGKPTYEAINGMAYLDAVFNESMRRHPQANVLDRLCVKPFELPAALPGGRPLTLQPGMVVWIPVAGIHFDEQYYDEPDKFDPERFLNKKVTINQTDSLGFGIGPRSCIGNRFAILETKILFFHVLAKFNLRPNAKTVNPFKYRPGSITLTPKGGFWLTVEPRQTMNK